MHRARAFDKSNALQLDYLTYLLSNDTLQLQPHTRARVHCVALIRIVSIVVSHVFFFLFIVLN